jgi:hypothetical protein
MDHIRDELGLDNDRRPATSPSMLLFSSRVDSQWHFTAQDEELENTAWQSHNRLQTRVNKVADYGGGFGELALAIAYACGNTKSTSSALSFAHRESKN